MTGSLDSPAFRDALVILGAVGVVIPAFTRFKVNPVIGFILVGLLLGPSGLGALEGTFPFLRYVSIGNRDTIEPFAEFGIILLLFSIGLELSYQRLWELRRLVFLIGPAEVLVSASLIALVLVSSGMAAGAAIALGLALSLSSTALVLPMTGTRSPVGKPAFAMLMFEDVAIVPIIFVLGVLGPASDDAAVDELLRVVVGGGIVVGVILVAGKLVLPRILRQAARAKSPEMFIAVAIAVVMASSLATSLVGLSPIVGALVAGLTIAETEYRAQVEVTIEPFKNLALGIFLITVGMSLDIERILADWQMVIMAVVGVLVVKTLVTGGLLRIAGAPKGVAAQTGILMASPSETTLIVLAAAAQARLIDADTMAFWQIVTAIGLTLTPLLARIGRDTARRVDDAQALLELPAKRTDTPPTIIAGYGRVGQMVADMLVEHQQPFVLVDADIDLVRAGRARGHDIIFGDVSRPEILERIGVAEARSLVLTMNDPVQQAATTRAMRAAHPDLIIIARARDAEHAAELYRAGATDAVPETLESSLQLAEAVLVDIGRPMGPVIASIHEMRDRQRAIIKAMVPDLDHEPLRAASRRGNTSPTDR
jgi:CPA2 family monovalent cation:H+ antiporter-2